MEPIEYIKKFHMDQPRYSFDRIAFLQAMSDDLQEQIANCKMVDPEHEDRIPYFAYNELVKNAQVKYKAISSLKHGSPLSKALWKAFYAIHVVPLREKLFPERIAKIKAKYEKRRQAQNN